MDAGAFVRACRPRHWTKNFLVFAAPLFAFTLDKNVWLAASGSLVAFCLISSAIYLLNDSLDVEVDRQHPRKRYRSIAAGQVSVPLALTTSALLALVSLIFAAALSDALAGLILAYGLIQVGYCLRLKHEPLLDLFCISAGFILRAMAGGVAAELALSPWFLLTVGLLALFLAVEKRKAELQNILGGGVINRKVLNHYSLPLLLRLESLASTSTFMSYALWAAGPALNGASTNWMLLTIPFILIGIFRYQLLSDPIEAERTDSYKMNYAKSEVPEEILLRDQHLQVVLIAWLATIVGIGIATNSYQ